MLVVVYIQSKSAVASKGQDTPHDNSNLFGSTVQAEVFLFSSCAVEVEAFRVVL